MKRFFRNPIKWFRRLRTSHGFGVHSPFAFDFITNVLRDYDAYYYAYPEIDSLCGKTHRDTKIDNILFHQTDFERGEARMLFRILVKFQPELIVEMGGANEVTRTIIDRACPNAEIQRWSRLSPFEIDYDKRFMIIVNQTNEMAFNIQRRYILEAIEKQRNQMLIFSHNIHLPTVRRLFNQVEMVLTYGQTFFDDFTAVYVGNSKLPRQIYNINL